MAPTTVRAQTRHRNRKSVYDNDPSDRQEFQAWQCWQHMLLCERPQAQMTGRTHHLYH